MAQKLYSDYLFSDLMEVGWVLAPDKQTGMSFLSSALKILPSLKDRKKEEFVTQKSK
ncbi:hypothetical protein [Aerococcus viridans]|uniref:hypothetical protein n=1 Tax=Aerococcus viridans TaxID=1377 RepID=UPI0039AF6930